MDWTVELDDARVTALASRVAARRGRMLLLVGDAGAGKSTLGAEVARRLAADGFRVLPVLAMPELQGMPLGAMATLLAGVEQLPGETAADRLQRLAATLAPATSRAVLVIDDGPHLDDVSAAAVRQLVRASGVRCIMSARTGLPLPGPVAHLEDEGLVEREHVTGLDDEAASAAVERALGGPVESESLKALLRRAGGNPLFLRELVTAIRRDGGSRPTPAGLALDSIRLPDRVNDTIAARFDALEPLQRRTAELIAVGQPLPAELLGSSRQVAALERLTLASRLPDGQLRLAHPLHGEFLIAELTEAELDERRIEAARMLEAGQSDDLRFRAVGLLAEGSTPPTTDEIVWAAEHANTLEDRAVAIRLAESALRFAGLRGEPRPSAALVVLADALSFSGRLDEADAAFDESLAAARTDAELAQAATRAGFHHAIRHRHPERAVQIGTVVLGRLADPSAHGYLTANIAKWKLMAGQTDLSAAAPLSGSEDAALALNPHLFRLPAAIFAGDLTAARASIEVGRPLVEAARAVTRHGGELLDFGEYLVLLLEARGEEAVAFAEQVRPDRFDEASGMWSYGIALAEYHAGRLDDAFRLASAGVEQLEWRDFLGALGAARGLRAAAAAARGDRARTAELLAPLEADAGRFVTADLQVAEARAWLLADAGDRDAAAAAVAEAASTAIEVGYASFAALTAHVAVRVGRPDAVLAILATAAERAPSSALVALLHEHAEALAASDAVRLLAVAEALAGARFRGAAHDAAVQAADAARESGSAATARRARGVAARLAAELQPQPASGALEELLSSRELAVARLAADRERNREIAERLGISLRTVENHLASIYRKLGVTGRDELRAALR